MLLAVTAILPVATAAAENAYYVDSINGDDSKDGRTPETAWKNLTKVNNAPAFTAGNQILLKRGSVWTEQFLSPKGSGSAGNPIIIDAYGDGHDPILNGNGITAGLSMGSVIYFNNQSYITVRNLEITNAPKLEMTIPAGQDPDRAAVYANCNTGVVRGITLENCYIHHIATRAGNSPKIGDSHSSAVRFFSELWSGGYSDIIVRNNTLYNVGHNGIHITGNDWVNSQSGRGNIVENNYLYITGGDAITVRSCTGPLVQNNIADRAISYINWWQSCIWQFQTVNALFQYNVAINTQGRMDSKGYDCDYQSKGTTYQYNYSYNNNGGFMLICVEPTNWDGGFAFNDDITIRYNISDDDKAQLFSMLGQVKNVQIYNNTIYLTGTTKLIGYSTRNSSQNPQHDPHAMVATDTVFSNNIVYSTSRSASISAGNSNTWNEDKSNPYNVELEFYNNIFHGPFPEATLDKVKKYDTNLIVSDPKFVIPPAEQSSEVFDLRGWMLKEGSPALGAGKVIENNVNKDFFGYAVSATEKPNIGAYNGPGVVGNVLPPTDFKNPERPTPHGEDIVMPTQVPFTEASKTTTEPLPIKGDINFDGKVNGMDLLLMKQHILDVPGKKIEEGTPAFFAADMNDDGKINGMDLLLLKKKILG